VQKEILEAHPNTPITVIAIWFSMVENDSRQGLVPDLLSDPRVVRLWDPERRAGKWYAQFLTGHNDPKQKYSDVEWDVWFLYGPEATWEQATQPVDWGRPVVATSEKLKRSVEGLLAASPRNAKKGGEDHESGAVVHL
jgi:hypothetical protein